MKKKHFYINTSLFSFLGITLFALLFSFSVSAKDIKILAIGNSFSEDAVEQYLYELALEGGDNLIIGNAYRGGQGLQSHWDVANENRADFEYRKVVGGVRTNTHSQTLLSCVLDEDWDYITFQQVSQDSGIESTYEPWLTYLLAYVKLHVTNSNVKYALHRTWAYSKDSGHGGFSNYGKDQQAMFEAIVSSVNSVFEKHDDISFIIPAGTAIQNARSSFIGDNFCRDGYHLSYGLGRYTAACTWLEIFTGQNPVGKTYKPNGVTELEAKIAQYAAHFAVEKPDKVTLMEDFNTNTIVPTHPVRINFGGTASSSAEWNNITPSNKASILNDIQGNDTEMGIKLDNDFSGTNTAGAKTTTTVLNMPEDVSSSCLWGFAKGTWGNDKLEVQGGFSFYHLNKNLAYDFYIFASRDGASDNRDTEFIVTGKNSKTYYLNAAGNTNNVVHVEGILPDEAGEIKLTVKAGPDNNNGNKFYYINALQIDTRLQTAEEIAWEPEDEGVWVDAAKTGWIAQSTTFQPINDPQKAIDGNTGSIWHTPWDGTPGYPYEIVVDMIETQVIGAFTYQARNDNENGRIRGYELYVSNDGIEWGSPVASGELENTSAVQEVKIPSKPEARYFKLLALSEVNNKNYASAAELGIKIPAPRIVLDQKKYYIKHTPSGMYLQFLSDASQGDFRIGYLKSGNDNFVFEFTPVEEKENVFNIGIAGQYINAGADDAEKCVLGNQTGKAGQIRLESVATDKLAFKMRSLWMNDKTNYIGLNILNSFYILADRAASGAIPVWQLEEISETQLILPENEKSYNIVNAKTGLYLTYPEVPSKSDSELSVAEKLEDDQDKKRQIFLFTQIDDSDLFTIQEAFSEKYLAQSMKNHWTPELTDDLSAYTDDNVRFRVVPDPEALKIQTACRANTYYFLGYENLTTNTGCYHNKTTGAEDNINWVLVPVSNLTNLSQATDELASVYSKNNVIYIQSGTTDSIQEVYVYNIQGMLLSAYKGINKQDFEIAQFVNSDICIVKVITEKGSYSTKVILQ